MIDILASAFLLSVILLGIHSFFGIEIIRRGIIFTDLAIGQTAALGAAVSILLFHGEFMYPLSLSFAVIGGLLIAHVAGRSTNAEAFIGLLYAFGISAVYIILSRSPHGTEEFGRLMAADILFTPATVILRTGALYLAIGIFLALIYRRSTGFTRDMIFFTTFALTVTSSVQLAGVLVVFALLVGPALIAIRIKAEKTLPVAWTVGTIINLLAITLSYRLDLPTGYTIVCCNALCALVMIALPVKNTCMNGEDRT